MTIPSPAAIAICGGGLCGYRGAEGNVAALQYGQRVSSQSGTERTITRYATDAGTAFVQVAVWRFWYRSSLEIAKADREHMFNRQVAMQRSGSGRM